MIVGWIMLGIFAVAMIYISWQMCQLPVEYGPTMWGNMSEGEKIAVMGCS